ncbi:hypothetical protein OEZ85_006614 [Tetradesmus obliquus]|uniref:ADP-ribosylation/Crystallin J1 n=1 Tax=Tetradesmus obliquus TaxID=3088 RepID=A0ABY8TV59_TETOB|nr:hypothetical protein OEZ85_006614 [Tetradesmus obliquus]
MGAHSVVVASAAASNSVATPAPGATDVAKGRQLVEQLERQAMEAHEQAQALNKQGRFEEAQAKYAEMRRLDAAALEATQALGCPSCAQAAAAAAASRADAVQQQQQSGDPQLYQQLHTPSAWTAAASATGGLSIAQRAAGAIIGCCVADAAATPVQWIYDVAKLQQLLQQRQQATNGTPAAAADSVGLEFFDPVQSSFLPMYTTGRNSPYGEQTLLLLRSLAEQAGLHCGRYAELYGASYSSGFDGYMNASTVAFLRNRARGLQPPATGAEDQQADCVARLAPLIAMYAGDERLMRLVEAATRTTQNTDAAAAWGCAGAAVLERLLLGQAAEQAVRETVQELQQQQNGGGSMPQPELSAAIAGHLEKVLQLQQTPHADAVQELGRNCHMPNALQTPIHAVLHHEWLAAQQQQQQQQADRSTAGSPLHGLSMEAKQRIFVAAIREVMLAGGCCASRASYAGACLGAVLGAEAVPQSWVRRCDAGSDVQAWAAAVCGAREVA